MGPRDWAIAEFDDAIRLNPILTLAYHGRGAAYLRLGQPQLSLQDFNETIRLERQFALAYGNRAIVYTVLGKDVEARQDIERAVELGGDRASLEMLIEKAKSQR